MQLQHLLASLAFALPMVAGSSMNTLGCYSNVAGLTDVKQFTFQTHPYCIKQCTEDGFKYAVLKDGATCGCTNTVPVSSAKVDDDKCDSACAGWPKDNCGGMNVYTVLTTSRFISSSNNTESVANTRSDSGSDSDSEPTSTAAVATTNGGIIIAATNAPTNTVTGASTMVTKGVTSTPSPSKSSIVSAGITSLSQSATPTATPNAADSLRAAPVAGALVAALGLLL